jgi:hypothetical protein
MLQTPSIKATFVWGEPEATPDNSVVDRLISIYGLLLFLIAAGCAFWPGFMYSIFGLSGANEPGDYSGLLGWGAVAICFAVIMFGLMFSAHLRLNGLTADKDGITIFYSCMSEPDRAYVTKNCRMDWANVSEVSVAPAGDETENYSVHLYLNKTYADNTATCSMAYADEKAALLAQEALNRLRIPDIE